MRSTALLFLLISVFGIQSVRSQSDELLVQGQTGKLFLLHTVVAKENWYSIGRMYNIGPKELAPYNALTLDKPLSIGQEIKVPLTPVNFSQTGQKAAATETLVPVYHIIQEKEWMYRISVNNNKVPIANLEKWNNINKDQVKAGMHLVVGFLKVKTAQSALAAAPAIPKTTHLITPPSDNSTSAKISTEDKPVVTTKPVTTPATTRTTSADKAAADKSTSDKTAADKLVADKAIAEKSSAIKSTTDKTASDKPSANKPSNDKLAINKPASDRPPVEKPAPAVSQPAIAVSQPASAPHFNGGFFGSDFSETGKSVSGPASSFKSTSGWQDGKYYALMNNVPVGTIVRINVPSTSKTVYAKVLGQLPDMRESAGLTIRISNAAAGELGEGDGRFNVEVKY